MRKISIRTQLEKTYNGESTCYGGIFSVQEGSKTRIYYFMGNSEDDFPPAMQICEQLVIRHDLFFNEEMQEHQMVCGLGTEFKDVLLITNEDNEVISIEAMQ